MKPAAPTLARSPARRWRLAAAVMLATLAFGALRPATGAEETAGRRSAEGQAASGGELAAEAIQGRIDRLKEAAEPEHPLRHKLIQTYTEALEQRQKAEELHARAEEFGRLRQAAPELLAQVKGELARPPEEVSVSAPTDAELRDLEQQLTEAEAALAAARASHAELEDEPKRRAERRLEVAAQLAAAEEELARVKQQLEAAPTGEPAELAEAEQALILARKKALEQEINAHKAELLSYDARRNLLSARRDKAARTLREAEQLVEAWRRIVNERRQQEARHAVQEARQATAEAHPAVRHLAEENQRLAEIRTGPEGLAARIQAASQQLQESQDRLNDLKADFARVQERVQTAGLTKAIGALLRKKRAELPRPRRYQRRISSRQDEIAEAELKLLELEEQRADLADAEAAGDEILAALDVPPGEDEREEVRQAAVGLLAAKRDLLDALISGYETHSTTLLNLNIAEEQLAAAARDYADYVDEKILW
ncbi:MAG: hypothetical protein ACYS8K_09020, partial [Planctomycetota bacterium]